LAQLEQKKAFDKYAKNKFFKSKGKMAEKDVYQQDIDPDKKIGILTKGSSKEIFEANEERMRRGLAPYVEKNGKDEILELHHSRQKDSGPIFEISKSSHAAKTKQGGEALHPYRTKAGREANGLEPDVLVKVNPNEPVERKAFDKERSQYWKDRIEKLLLQKDKKE
jgi:hypothetical protein